MKYTVLTEDNTVGYTDSVPNYDEIFLITYRDENGNLRQKQEYIVEILEREN